jgi:hypothetical protein
LNKIRPELLHGIDEGIVMRLLPASRADLFAYVGGAAEYSTEQAAGGIQRTRNRPGSEGLKTRTIAGPTAVAIELELEPAIGAVVRIILREFYFFAHLRHLQDMDRALCNYITAIGFCLENSSHH